MGSLCRQICCVALCVDEESPALKRGVVLLQQVMYLWIGRNCHPNFLTQVLAVPNYAAVPDNLVGNNMFQLGPHSAVFKSF